MKSADVLTKHFFIFMVLMVLLGLTFFLAHIDLGPLNTLLGLLIALIKAAIVGLFFMNLRYSDGIHRVFAITGLFLLGVLFSLGMADFLTRGWLPMPGPFPVATEAPLESQ